jgi:hypothetical protein
MPSGKNDMAEEVWTGTADATLYFLDVTGKGGCRASLMIAPRPPFLICDAGRLYWLESDRPVNPYNGVVGTETLRDVPNQDFPRRLAALPSNASTIPLSPPERERGHSVSFTLTFEGPDIRGVLADRRCTYTTKPHPIRRRHICWVRLLYFTNTAPSRVFGHSSCPCFTRDTIHITSSDFTTSVGRLRAFVLTTGQHRAR